MLNNIKGFRSFYTKATAFSLAIVFSVFLAVAHEHEHKNDGANTEDTAHAVAEADSNHATHAAGEAQHGEAHGTEKFDAGKMIMEHVADAHDWHLWGHTSIPLPVILYSSRGLAVFSSSKFEHGHADYNGYRLEHGHIVAVNENGSVNDEITASIWDISITKNTASLFISLVIMLLVFISVAKAYTRNPNSAPKGLQAVIEPLVIFVRDDVAKASIGPKYQKFMPFLLTVFFFIFINNLLGLVPVFPGGANLTGNIAITMSLAVFTFVITTINGTKDYWRHIVAMPGVPAWVLVLLTPIEILGVFLRPFVLMVRLFANITAGHIIALSFFSLIFIFGEMSPVAGLGVSVFSLAFTVFMTCMELLVAFLQAYVFTLLSAIYFGSAVEEHHHAEEHH
ncbi:MAG: ATP synthase subunit a [Bacteroidia bacterium]|nr:ATP synthase subunit a [Bacteroidia bacterium]